MEIQACPECASLDMRTPGIGDGAILGYATVSAVCPECGFQGAPLLFDDEEAYHAFRLDVVAARKGASGLAGADEEGPRGRAAEGPDDGADASTTRDEDLPDWARAELDAPGPGRRAPATAFLIGALGVFGLASGAFLAVSGAITIAGGGAGVVTVVMTLAFVAQALVSVALLRIAARLWRGGPRPTR